MKLFLQKFSLLLLTAFFSANAWAQTELPTTDEQKVFVTNEATINTENLEYSPAFYEDGIVFISSKATSKKFKIKDRRINKNIMSIFLAKRSESGLLQVPTPFAKELMTTVHEGPVTFDRTADFLFFTRNNVRKGQRKKAKDGIVKLQIFSAEKVRDTWSNVKALPFNDKESNTCHPAISVEGDLLYFSSDRAGGHGGMDIWVSRRLADEWGEPVNLGPEVNTEGEEVFPFVHADGTVYFASNTHVGFGGLDVFSTKKIGDSWAKPENLNPPFNSENDDFGFIIDRDKKNGYFSSNRTGGFGEDDIFSFYVNGDLDGENSTPRTEHTLSLVISDFESAEMIEGAQITHASLDDLSIAQAIAGQSEDGLAATLSDSDKELLVRVPLEENGTVGTSDNWGKYPVTILNGKHIFIIEKEGYQKRQVILDTKEAGEELFVSLEKLGSESSSTGTNIAVSSTTTTGPDGATIVTKTSADGSVITTTTKTNGDVVTNTKFTNGDYSTITSKPDGVTIIALSNPDGTVTTTTIAPDGTEASVTSAPSFVDNGSSGNGNFPSRITEGTVFQLPNIYYNFNDASIRPDATYDLEALASFLNQYQDIEIELSSHTDSRGGTRYNKRLSQKRAESAVRYLVNQGISSNRMTAVGYGESELRNRCSDGVDCSEDEHQFNRRTQVRITKMANDINIQFINSESSIADSGSGSINNGYNGGGSVSTSSSDSYEGDYRVVAGIYSVYDNAETKVARLNKLGYNEAQIVNMDGSEKYMILVKTCSDKAEAKQIVKELKKNKIRSFVKS